MMKEFLIPVALAAVFATLFHPLFRRLTGLFGGRRTAAALACCILLFLLLVIPLYLVAQMVASEAADFYRTAQVKAKEIVQQGEAGPIGALHRSRWARQLGLDTFDWRASLKEGASSIGGALAGIVNKASRGTIQVIVILFMTLFTLFYFFRDGERIVRRVGLLIPLEPEYKQAIAERFASVSRATVRGTLVIALVQGTLSGLTLWIFGAGSPFLWGVVATLTSIVPLVGAWVVLYPAAFYQMATGQVWQGVGILIVTVVLIVNIDNVLRPRLVGAEVGMHDLMVFFSTLGGIGLFGPMGFILGPMIAALFLSVLDIYSEKFKADLDQRRSRLVLPSGLVEANDTPIVE
jgi:predicted PurR-regulated permease PerM